MREHLSLPAYAKINLAIDILGKRADGYHEVAMIMQSIDLADFISLSAAEQGISLTTDCRDLPADADNLAWRAAALLQQVYGVKQGVHIHIEKNIPLAAGLAGGSADAAAVLRGLNLLWDLQLTNDDLETIGSQLGSDVPFCIDGGTVLATGRGEILTPIAPLMPCYVVLAKPPISVSTAWVYDNFKLEHVIKHPDIPAMIAAIGNGDRERFVNSAANVLETVTIKEYPILAELKKNMQQSGALLSMMSGSGPTVFGLAATKGDADTIAHNLAGSASQIYIAKILKKVGEDNGTATFTGSAG